MMSYLGNESSDASFPNFEQYIFDVDHVAKIRSELSIAVLEEKKGDLPEDFHAFENCLDNFHKNCLALYHMLWYVKLNTPGESK